jgi:hypothetical protein
MNLSLNMFFCLIARKNHFDLLMFNHTFLLTKQDFVIFICLYSVFVIHSYKSRIVHFKSLMGLFFPCFPCNCDHFHFDKQNKIQMLIFQQKLYYILLTEI